MKKIHSLIFLFIILSSYSQCPSIKNELILYQNQNLSLAGICNTNLVQDLILVNISGWPYTGNVNVNYGFDGNTSFLDTVIAVNGLPGNGTLLLNLTLDSACGAGDFKIWIDAACDSTTYGDTLAFQGVTIDCPPSAGSINAPPLVCLGDTVQVDLAGYNGIITSWEYSTDGGVTWTTNATSSSTDSIFNINQPTIVQVNVDSPGGICAPATTSVSINTVVCPVYTSIMPLQSNTASTNEFELDDIKLTIPNLITPNGDGINDLWIIENISEFDYSKLIILDLNGQIVFEAQPYLNDWTTTKVGSYLYSVQLNYKEGSKPIQGVLTVATDR